MLAPKPRSMLALVALTLAAPAAWGGSRTVSTSSAPEVDVSIVGSTSVRVVGWDKNEVKVEAPGKGEPKLRQSGDTLRIRSVPGLGDWLGEGTLILHVPTQAKIRVKLISGSIQAEGLAGAARLQSVSGNVEAKGCSGSVRMVSVSGSVRAQGMRGALAVKAVSGDVEIQDAASPEVGAKSVSGKIELRAVSSRRVEAKAHSGDIVFDGSLPADGALEAKTFSGSVQVTLPSGAGFEIEAKTHSGKAEVKFPGFQHTGKTTEGRLQGKVGAGGATLHVKSFSGNIAVTPK
jgi:hypothetical protein